MKSKEDILNAISKYEQLVKEIQNSMIDGCHPEDELFNNEQILEYSIRISELEWVLN